MKCDDRISKIVEHPERQFVQQNRIEMGDYAEGRCPQLLAPIQKGNKLKSVCISKVNLLAIVVGNAGAMSEPASFCGITALLIMQVLHAMMHD